MAHLALFKARDRHRHRNRSKEKSCIAITGRPSFRYVPVPLLVLLLQLLLLLLLLQLLLLLLNVVPANVAVHGNLLRGAIRAHGTCEGLLAGVRPDVAAEVVAAPEGLSAEGARPGDARWRGGHLGATAGGGGRSVGQEEGGVRLLKELQLQERSRGHIQEARSGCQALPARGGWQGGREGGGKCGLDYWWRFPLSVYLFILSTLSYHLNPLEAFPTAAPEAVRSTNGEGKKGGGAREEGRTERGNSNSRSWLDTFTSCGDPRQASRHNCNFKKQQLQKRGISNETELFCNRMVRLSRSTL